MELGIVGLPRVGKSLTFRLISGIPQEKLKHDARPQMEMVTLPDDRLQFLSDRYQPKKTTFAQFKAIDFPAIDLTSRHRGEILGEIRSSTDSLLIVLQGSETMGWPHPSGKVDPARDLSELLVEFQVSDLGIIENRIEKLKVQVLKPTKHVGDDKAELALLEGIHKRIVENNELLSEMEFSDKETEVLRGYRFLSQKPVVALVNVADMKDAEGVREKIALKIGEANVLAVNVQGEVDILELAEDEREMFIEELGIGELHGDKVKKTAYRALGLISFFTSGKDECRAWTIREGDDAVTAAGKIHQDLARGFISAEVTHFEDFHRLQDEKLIKAEGKLKIVGKEFKLGDGDIIVIRHNG
ncbi:MAG: DUF933 domain-containing protein [Planctomycetes bacterium]|nr:DUF933 domain-containing protein [Planctomycetota bacterium]